MPELELRLHKSTIKNSNIKIVKFKKFTNVSNRIIFPSLQFKLFLEGRLKKSYHVKLYYKKKKSYPWFHEKITPEFKRF